MAHPIEPQFGRHGEYTTQRTTAEAFRQGTIRNMYSHDSPPLNLWQKMQLRADVVRDAMGDKCCRCLHKMPSLVLIVGIILLIALAIAAIPIAFILVSNAGGEHKADALAGGGKTLLLHRKGYSWPVLDEGAESVVDTETNMGLISAASIFPPNVSLCHGFGFVCTNKPSLVVSTTVRCDGKADCPDGSDELNCLECQSAFWCEKDKSGLSSFTEKKTADGDKKTGKDRLCLRSSHICDGVNHCPNSFDETSFCRKEEEECPSGTKRCSNSTLCLPLGSFCDGVIDCLLGDDEKDCKECKRGAKMCGPSKICMQHSQLCDGNVDCSDGSDELNCQCKECSGSDRALCDNGRCLARSRVCDGFMDCQGGLDEMQCPGTCKGKEVKEEKMVLCGDARRYPMDEACSGELPMCSRSCNECSKNAFKCNDKKCIRKVQVCDGTEDCTGGEDEERCNDPCDRPSHHKCPDKKCIAKTSVCDGVKDCSDGSDERKCDKCDGGIFCPSERRCLSSRSRCNGVKDCSDGSDEKDCNCDACSGVHSGTFSCESSPHCFTRQSVCNPYSRCPNATHTDKMFCASRVVERSIF